MNTEFRPLTPEERRKEIEQKTVLRTKYEKWVYRHLPDCMKDRVLRNSGIAIKEHVAYYPDLTFLDERICIEVDGDYHLFNKNYDIYRENTFKKHGFDFIRLRNKEACCSITVCATLLCELKKIERLKGNPMVEKYIHELQRSLGLVTDLYLADDEDNNYDDDFCFCKRDQKIINTNKRLW